LLLYIFGFLIITSLGIVGVKAIHILIKVGYFNIRGRPAYLQDDKELLGKKSSVRGKYGFYKLYVSKCQAGYYHVDIFNKKNKEVTVAMQGIEANEGFINILKAAVKKHEKNLDATQAASSYDVRLENEDEFALKTWSGDVYDEKMVFIDKGSTEPKEVNDIQGSEDNLLWEDPDSNK